MTIFLVLRRPLFLRSSVRGFPAPNRQHGRSHRHDNRHRVRLFVDHRGGGHAANVKPKSSHFLRNASYALCVYCFGKMA